MRKPVASPAWFRAPLPAGALAPDQAHVTTGRQAELRSDLRAPLVAEADIVTAASWRMRQLSSDHAGLDEIVAELNRYNRTPSSGVFDAHDPNSFIAFLDLSTAVEVDRSQPGRMSLGPR